MPQEADIQTSAPKPKLLDRVRASIRSKHYGMRTEDAYVQWIRRFVLFHNKRHPREIRAEEIDQFLSHLAVEHKVSASTRNQALCAVPFFHKEVLHIEIGLIEDLVWSKKPGRLPVVLARE
jgi:site-specific recombinase XerD